MLRFKLVFIILTFINSGLLFAQCPLNLGEIPPVTEDDMLLYFPFDGTAENFGDSTYSAEVNGAKYVDSGCGKGLEFDGEDDYVRVTPSLYLDESYTVTAWVNARSFVNQLGIFCIREQCLNTYRGFSISEWKVGGNVDFPTLKNSINRHSDCIGLSQGDRHTDTNLFLANNEDVFVGLTVVNNRSEDRIVKMYVNCQEYQTELVDNASTGICFDNPLIEYMTTIGAASDVPGFEKSFDGIVDEVRVYDRLLSHDEIKDIYRNCRPVTMEFTRFTDCESDSAVIALHDTQLGVDYQLYDLNKDTIVNGPVEGNCNTLFFYTDRVDTITSYEIIATDTLSGCSIRMDSVITLNPLDSLDLSFDYSFPNFACLGDSTQVLYEGDSTLTREWRITTPNFQDSILLNVESFTIQFVDTGEYSVSLIIEDENGCVDTISKEIQIDAPLVKADFWTVPYRCEEDSIWVFINDESISQDSLGYTSEWSFFNPDDSLISTQRPFFITEEGEYTVVLKVTDSNGCMDTTSRTVSSPFIGLGCCPDFTVPPVEACNLTRLEICGQTNLDSCVVDYLYAEYTFSYDDSVAVVERVPVDSQGRFCFEADESILDREECVTGWVDVFFIIDSSGADTITFGSEILNLSGDCLNEKCCPEDTLRINIAKNLCLTGSNYEGAHFAIEGSILLNALPEDLEYCDTRPVFDHGVEIDYEYFSVFGGVVKFKGMLYIPYPDVLERDPATGKYLIPGTMVFCDANGNECVISIYIRISRSQLDMCVGMPGLMCMHFEVNTYQYQPPIPPQQFNGRVYLPLSVRVPYGIRTNGESECEVNRYDYEVCGIPKQGANAQSCISLATGQINRTGLEIAGTIFEFLSIPVDQWNRLSHIQLRFRNNCGDRCDLDPIPVVPLSGGRGELADRAGEEEVKVYPIPFSDRLTISYPKSYGGEVFQIYSSEGKEVFQGNLNRDVNTLSLRTAHWAPGMYVLTVLLDMKNRKTILLIKS